MRGRFVRMKKDIDELLHGGQGSHIWGARAHDMRVYISHTTKLFGVHAASEYKLFMELRGQLVAEFEEKGK